jgi:hypothetical protein
MDVLSFDCGLRNLAAAVVRITPGFAFPPEYKTYADDTETADQFKERALAYFVRHAWTVVHARLIDISESLGRQERVKRVKSLGLMSKATGIYNVLDELEQQWFADSATDIVAVEIQHGVNAEMRAVSLAIPIFFMRSMREAAYEGVVGGKKLKVCDAVGVHIGHGLAHLAQLKDDKKAAKAAARKGPVRKRKSTAATVMAAPPEDGSDDDADVAPAAFNPYAKGRFGGAGRGRGKGSDGMTAREKYEDNKGRAMQTMAKLMEPRICASAEIVEAVKDPNVADAVLQGVWVLWTRVAPRAPTRRRASKKIKVEES